MENNLEQYYQDVYLRMLKHAEEALLLKIKEAVSAMSSQTAILIAKTSELAKAVYKGEEYMVEALSIRNGHMIVHIREICPERKTKAVPVKYVEFINIPKLVKNVIASTCFPDNLRMMAETFYGKPVEMFGQTLRIMEYLRRENGIRRDHYIFRLDNGEPIALTSHEIMKAAEQQTKNKAHQ